MLGSNQEDAVVFAAGRVGVLAALVLFAIALAVMPSVLAVVLVIAGPLAGSEPDGGWLGQVLQSLNTFRLGAGAGLLLTVPLLRGER